jgi:hypothetical protein
MLYYWTIEFDPWIHGTCLVRKPYTVYLTKIYMQYIIYIRDRDTYTVYLGRSLWDYNPPKSAHTVNNIFTLK